MTIAAVSRNLVTVAVLAGACALGSVLVGAEVPVLLWFGLSIVIVTSHRLVRRVAMSDRSEPLIREEADSWAFEMPDRPFAAMRAWEERFELVRGDGAYFRRTLVPMLTALVEERLRLAYGIQPDQEPERVRALLGPRLFDMLYGEANAVPTRAPSRSEMTTLVTEMEKLWTNHR